MRDFEYETFREDKKHTEVAFPYNTYLCSIPLDFSSVPVHWHEEMEFIVVKKAGALVTLSRESSFWKRDRRYCSSGPASRHSSVSAGADGV